jgi:hypothetical protein
MEKLGRQIDTEVDPNLRDNVCAVHFICPAQNFAVVILVFLPICLLASRASDLIGAAFGAGGLKSSNSTEDPTCCSGTRQAAVKYAQLCLALSPSLFLPPFLDSRQLFFCFCVLQAL